MKTAEEFLEYNKPLLRLWKKDLLTDDAFHLVLIKELEQFRKEGLQEIKPIIDCINATATDTYPEGVYARVKAIESLSEWYNNQIKEV